ncbi:MAG: DUF4918 family protein [Saprospiraceae bacterium]|nr:DUF4918 family protein [Saprospiraceae bacterium]
MKSTKKLHAPYILRHHFGLIDQTVGLKLPKGVEWLVPYSQMDTRRTMTAYYNKYYLDNQPRIMIFGINPGRFGAGLTGVPFTDPIKLEEECGIPNSFSKRQELSAQFIYKVIHGWGGVELFFKSFYISSLCPLGFVLHGVNYNYYDDKKLQQAVEPFILQNIRDQVELVQGRKDIAYCLGEGKNFAYFEKINAVHHFFDKIVPLPHPRWIMQYRRKSMATFENLYLERLAQSSI